MPNSTILVHHNPEKGTHAITLLPPPSLILAARNLIHLTLLQSGGVSNVVPNKFIIARDDQDEFLALRFTAWYQDNLGKISDTTEVDTFSVRDDNGNQYICNKFGGGVPIDLASYTFIALTASEPGGVIWSGTSEQ